MSNSPLVVYTHLSPCNSGKRTAAIDRITPHCVVGQCTAESLGAWFATSSRKASCNYGIDRDGRVCLIVEEDSRSWCSSSNSNDNRAVTIECASDTKAPYAFRDAVYQSLIRLCIDICRRNGKTRLLWIADKDKALTYTPGPHDMLLTVHTWFANKECPGEWMLARMSDLAYTVTEALKPAPDPAPAPAPVEDAEYAAFKKHWQRLRKELQDNDASNYSQAAREWAVAQGIINGGSSEEFNGMWEDLQTREQTVTVLYRYDQLREKA